MYKNILLKIQAFHKFSSVHLACEVLVPDLEHNYVLPTHDTHNQPNTRSVLLPLSNLLHHVTTSLSPTNFNFTSPVYSGQLSSTALFTRPSITSTSFLHTRPPANGSLSWIKGWLTDGFSVMKNVLPVAFLALANVAHYNLLLLLLLHKENKPHRVYQPKIQNICKRKV